jgi:hypothetical protein
MIFQHILVEAGQSRVIVGQGDIATCDRHFRWCPLALMRVSVGFSYVGCLDKGSSRAELALSKVMYVLDS